MEFITKSPFSDAIEVVRHQLDNGTWQSDLMVGFGVRKALVDRNQHKTEKAAKKWAESVLQSYYESRIKN